MEKRRDFDHCVQKIKEAGSGKPPDDLGAVHSLA